MRPLSFLPLAVAALMVSSAPAQTAASDEARALARLVPASETLSFSIEWRLTRAGNARLNWAAGSSSGWQASLSLQSAGLVSRLYKIDNEYSSVLTGQLCVTSALLKAHEGSRRRETRATFDGQRKKASLVENDLVKNIVVNREIDILPCEIGALYQLRVLNLEPGQSASIPVSDGKKAAQARVEAQERETVKIGSDTYKTIRYEAFLFNGVLYRRQARVFVWLTDDQRRLPVQIRVRMPFYIGTVTLQIQKQGKS
jgi:hypothetical protein